MNPRAHHFKAWAHHFKPGTHHSKVWAHHLQAWAHHLTACVHHLNAWVHHLKAWTHQFKAWAPPFKGLGSPFKCLGSPFRHLILSCVKQNGLDGCTPPRFSLRSWEQLSKLLLTFYPGVPLYGTHIDLKNAFWSFVLPESARTVFRLRSGRSGRVVGLGRLPFGWKYSPFICQQTLARIVERVLPPDILLVH